MNLTELNDAAERHPWLWALGAGAALGLFMGVLYRSLPVGAVVGVGMFLIQLFGAAVRRVFRGRR